MPSSVASVDARRIATGKKDRGEWNVVMISVFRKYTRHGRSSRKLPASNGTGPAAESTIRPARQPVLRGRLLPVIQNDDPHRSWFSRMPVRTLCDSEIQGFRVEHPDCTGLAGVPPCVAAPAGRVPAKSTARSPKTNPGGKKPKAALHHKFNHLIELWKKGIRHRARP